MKIRNGFVTNSSSSSFVVGFKADGIKEIEQTLDQVPAIFKSAFLLVKKLFDFDKAIATEEDLIKHFLDQYGWNDVTIGGLLEDDEYLNERYHEMLEYINNGYGIIDINVDYSDETLNELLSSLPREDSEIILISNDY